VIHILPIFSNRYKEHRKFAGNWMVFVVIALPIIEISYRTQTLFEAAGILAAKEQQKNISYIPRRVQVGTFI